MEYININMNNESETAFILCCECGVTIKPNPSNMCVSCLRKHVDISENIPKQCVLHFCRNCERYLQPPGEWISAALESRELLSICLKKLKGIKDVKLIDAGFVWTEPHSKRIKVKLTIHGEVADGTVLQQVFIVEFSVQNQMCDNCHKIEAKDFWRCLVQVRQRAENKKTFYYLEQLILKYKAHENTLSIKPIHGGLDFYYSNESHARKLVDFLQSTVPVKVTTSKRLISHDVHSNNYNYKYTWGIEIVPLSKDSLVCIPKKLRQRLGNLSPICLVQKVATTVHLIDPMTTQIAELSSQEYFRSSFEPICNPNQLVEYIVMDIEEVGGKNYKINPGQGPMSVKHILCEVWLVRASEIGINENMIHTRSHLGHLLKIGDSVLGYNLAETNINQAEFEKLSADKIPDVILIRKIHADQQSKTKQRAWKLKHLGNEDSNVRDNSAYHEFLDDLEQDPDYRKNVNIYRNRKCLNNEDTVQADENDTHITLAEMLDDLTLECDDDSMGEEA